MIPQHTPKSKPYAKPVDRLKPSLLEGCEIYASCEPCPMCLAAIYWARLDALYFAASRTDAANAGFDDALLYEEVPRPWESRILNTEMHLNREAQQVFEAWKTKSDRIDY